MDGRTRPSRIASVLKGLKADVVALQEVIGAGPGGRGQEEEIGAQLNMVSVLASARTLRGHLYGNGLLSRFPIHQHITYDLAQATEIIIGRRNKVRPIQPLSRRKRLRVAKGSGGEYRAQGKSFFG